MPGQLNNIVLFILCLLLHRPLYFALLLLQLDHLGPALSTYALLFMGINAWLLTAHGLLFFVAIMDKVTNK